MFILSAPRTGSSWLAGTLARHPDLDVRGHVAHDNYNLYLSQPFLSLNPFADDSPHARSVLLGGLSAQWLRWRYRARESGRVLVIATPTSAAYLPLLVRAFPAARFVHLSRDGLDQVASASGYLEWVAGDSCYAIARRLWAKSPASALLAVGGRSFHRWRWLRFAHEGFLVTRPRGFQKAARHPRLEFLCWYLASTEFQIHEVLSTLPPGQRHSCRYETLVGDPGEIGRLTQFLGVSSAPEFLSDFRSSAHRKGVGRHKNVFDESEIAAVQQFLENAGLAGKSGFPDREDREPRAGASISRKSA